MAESKSELRLDTDVLHSAGTALKTISEDFDGANDRGKDVARLVGAEVRDVWSPNPAGALASAIRDFDSKWDDRRGKLKEGIDALATATTEIANTFDETDKMLADPFEPSGQPTVSENPTPADSTPGDATSEETTSDDATPDDTCPETSSSEIDNTFDETDMASADALEPSEQPTVSDPAPV